MNLADAITEQLLTGEAVTDHLADLASLRLDIFQEYPYLYRGRREDELAYLASYAKKPEACVILARKEDNVIGAASGMPLLCEGDTLRASFAETPYQPDAIYYIGELLFRPGYRNLGLGRRLLAQMESYIRSLGHYRKITCATVERPDDHPLRPADHIPISRFLARTGFSKLPGVVVHFAWLEADGVKRDHSMQFWMKDLPEAQG